MCFAMPSMKGLKFSGSPSAGCRKPAADHGRDIRRQADRARIGAEMTGAEEAASRGGRAAGPRPR